MQFVGASVEVPYLPEAGDSTGQRTSFSILLLFDEHYPILTFGESPGCVPPRDLSRLCYVEHEDAAGSQGVVDTAEESNQRMAIVPGSNR